MRLCDLHIHSCHSDGTFTPFEIVDRAKQKGLFAISITDHDEICAIEPSRTYGEEKGLQVISGVELSAIYKDKEIHILGYLFDENKKNLKQKLALVRKYREERAKGILEKLKSYGFHIEFELVKSIAGQGAIGRPHIAQAMLKSNIIRNYKEAFVKYIGNGKPCNVPKFRFSPEEAIGLIGDAGGASVIAHPGNIRDDTIVAQLLQFPFAGIEVFHPDHNSNQIKNYLSIAKERSLIATGGSDSHGIVPTKAPIGGVTVDYSVVELLREWCQAPSPFNPPSTEVST